MGFKISYHCSMITLLCVLALLASASFNMTIVGVNEGEKAFLRLAFDQAMVLAAAFNHDLGYKTLHKAYTSTSSPSFQCCLCLWTLAYLNAPNINRNCASSRLVAAQAAAQEASHTCLATENLLERELVSAMVARFPENRTAYNGALFEREFATRMGQIASSSVDNTMAMADLQAIFAEAVMNTIAWNYYNQEDGSLRDEAIAAKDSLDLALSIAPGHPLALHLTIHLFEPSSDPALVVKAERAGDTLKGLIPPDLGAGIGHLLHMPGHAFTRASGGRYHEAALVNLVGAADDSNYILACSVSPKDYYRQLYYTHKHAFLIWAAIMSGESKVAFNITEKLFEDANIMEGAGDVGGVFFSYPPWLYQILIKFGKYTEMEIASLPEPTGNELLDLYVEAIFFFARSYARASQGHCFESNEDRERFLSLASNEKLRRVPMFMIHVGDLLDLSEQIINGRLCGKCNNLLSCSEVEYLAAAVAIQDSFGYMEPPYWPDNVRSCLGAALLREDKPGDALAVFEKDLSTPQYPYNGWSLKGKELALRALGRDDEAEEVVLSFFEAWKFADVELQEPCF